MNYDVTDVCLTDTDGTYHNFSSKISRDLKMRIVHRKIYLLLYLVERREAGEVRVVDVVPGLQQSVQDTEVGLQTFKIWT